MALKHPQVMTSTEISKRLNITYKSALLLKRRIQLFASEVLIPMQRLFYSDMKKRYKDFKFPSDRNKNLTAKIRNKPIPQTDTVVLFSCSERANKGRKRYKRKGQTSSIYLSERLGGHQIGTLVNTLGVKNGPVFFDSIGDQKASTLNPIIMKYIPTHAPLFSDMGYKGYPGMNHRMVNHSARSDDKRHRYAKNRWSKNGIHCNVAEGNQAKLKRAFAAYTWIRPKYSQLYLNEYAFFGNRRFFALSEILGVMHGEKAAQELHLDRNGVLRCLYSNLIHSPSRQKHQPVPLKVKNYFYEPKSLLEIQSLEVSKEKQEVENHILREQDRKVRASLSKAVEAHREWKISRPTKDQRRKQKYFEALATKAWSLIPEDGYIEIRELADTLELNSRHLFRMLEVWKSLGLAELQDRSPYLLAKHAKVLEIRRKAAYLPPIIYVQKRS
ncbi:MAG: transposase [Spirochaetota bacterium]